MTMSYNEDMDTTTKSRTNNDLIQVRVPEDLKVRTSELFKSLGTSTSDVIRMMLVRADETKSIPFPIRSGAYPISTNERIDEVAASLELEDLPLDAQNFQDLREIELAKTTTNDVRERILGREY